MSGRAGGAAGDRRTAPWRAAARRTLLALLLGCAALVGGTGDAAGQPGTPPSTLRYGTGLLDVPLAAVPPHLAVTGTFSAFSLDVPERVRVGPGGDIIGTGDRWSRWFTDGSAAVGLFDRAEVGVTLQSFAAPDSGGTMAGGFGHVLLVDPRRQDGLGVAVGARYLTSPGFERSQYEGEYRPGRLGFADARLRRSYSSNAGAVDTNLTPYAVVSGSVPGFDVRYLPRHDLTFAIGWGSGLFADGGELPWYASSSSGGWFFGGAAHVEVRRETLVHLSGEYNGFDTNLGAQLDVGGIRFGTFVLGVNHDAAVSAYRSRKWGVSASFAICPTEGWRCGSGLRERAGPDTVQLPAPPPDTVRLPPREDTLERSDGHSRRGPEGVERTIYAPVWTWSGERGRWIPEGGFRRR